MTFSKMEEVQPTTENQVVTNPIETAMTASDDKQSTIATKEKDDAEKGNHAETKIDNETPAAPTGGNEPVRAWDHTDRKVIVHNVLKYLRPKEINPITASWLEYLDDPKSIKIEKVKKPPTSNWIQVTLEKEEMVQPFIDIFQNNRVTNRRGQPMFAKRVDPKTQIDDRDRDSGSADRKRKANGDDSRPDSKRSRVPKTADEVRDAITPLWRESYEKQVERKFKEMIKKCSMKIVNEVKGKFRTLEKEARRHKNEQKRAVPPMYDWLTQKGAIRVEDIIPSPQKVEYRNKSEFTFGYNLEMPTGAATDGTSIEDQLDNMKKTPAVGFMASGWAGGVSRPHCCQNIPNEACTVADIVDEFLKTSSLPPYDRKQHVGVWRTITIRTSKRTGECMIIIVHAPPSGGIGAKDSGADDYSKVFENERSRLVDMLKEKELGNAQRDYPQVDGSKGDDIMCAKSSTEESIATDDKPVRVTSIFFQDYGGVSMPSPEHPVQHAFGEKVLQERLGKCTFQISPGAFFQVNTECAEALYNAAIEKVKEVSDKPEETLLFDICCGTGTIGLSCMKEGVVGSVVGVDISQPAIQDANANAKLNGYITTDDDSSAQLTKFIASRAEHALKDELTKVKNSSFSGSIVAVVDPAREGLHPDVVKTIRMNEKIQRLVYVSCNPTATLVRDAALLCQPATKKYRGQPFRPVSAQPVDMFPQTPHCEMVMTFDRLEDKADASVAETDDGKN